MLFIVSQTITVFLCVRTLLDILLLIQFKVLVLKIIYDYNLL